MVWSFMSPAPPHQIHMLKSKPPKMMVIGGWACGRCLSHEVEPSGRRLMPYQRGSGEIPPYALLPCEDRGGASYELGREASLERNHAGAMILYAPASRLWEASLCCLWANRSEAFCYHGLNELRHHPSTRYWIKGSGRITPHWSLSYWGRPQKQVDIREGLWRSGGIKTSAMNGICRGLFISKYFQVPLKSCKSPAIFQQPTQRPLSLLCTSKNSPLGLQLAWNSCFFRQNTWPPFSGWHSLLPMREGAAAHWKCSPLFAVGRGMCQNLDSKSESLLKEITLVLCLRANHDFSGWTTGRSRI